MKKLITLMLAVCLVFAMVGIYASAETLDGVEDLATYTVPDSTKYGQSWYIDAEGEYKLFDGVIPDTNTLDAARDEAMKEDPDIKDWYAWDGWIALARSIAGDAYELNKSVNIDFRFEREVALKEMIFHTAAMAQGSVGNPTEYRIYVSEDGETYSKSPVATIAGSGEANEPKLVETRLTLDEAVSTSYVRVVMDAPVTWVFVSEVEIYEDLVATDAVTAGEILAAEAEEESSEPEESSAPEESSEPEESAAAPSEDADDESSAAVSEEESSKEESSKAASSTPHASSTAVSEAEADGGGNMWLWIVIAAVVVVVIVVVAIVVSKKKKAE